MTAEITGRKQDGRPFEPGQSGNPAGRPKGARHAALLALDAIGVEAGKDIMQAVVKAAKEGDMRGLTSCSAACGQRERGGR